MAQKFGELTCFGTYNRLASADCSQELYLRQCYFLFPPKPVIFLFLPKIKKKSLRPTYSLLNCFAVHVTVIFRQCFKAEITWSTHFSWVYPSATCFFPFYIQYIPCLDALSCFSFINLLLFFAYYSIFFCSTCLFLFCLALGHSFFFLFLFRY